MTKGNENDQNNYWTSSSSSITCVFKPSQIEIIFFHFADRSPSLVNWPLTDEITVSALHAGSVAEGPNELWLMHKQINSIIYLQIRCVRKTASESPVHLSGSVITVLYALSWAHADYLQPWLQNMN